MGAGNTTGVAAQILSADRIAGSAAAWKLLAVAVRIAEGEAPDVLRTDGKPDVWKNLYVRRHSV